MLSSSRSIRSLAGAIVATTLFATAVTSIAPLRAEEGRNGAAAAGAAAGFALGAATAAAAASRHRGAAYIDEDAGPRECYMQRRRVWDDDIGAYRVQRVRICE